MSLRDNNKSLVVTGDKGTGSLSGTLGRASGAVARPTGRALDVAKKIAAREPGAASGPGRVGFIIDATGSREASWAEAQKIQEDMFMTVSRFGTMALRLVHFGGNELSDLGWKKDADSIVSAMRKVECCGGITQILPALRCFVDDNKDTKASSVIVVGDSFEEDFDSIGDICALLCERNIKAFTFLDGESGYGTAYEAFKLMAEKTGGLYAAFGPDMPLKDLCEGVAVMSSGGARALHRLQDGPAKTLLLGVKPS